MRISIRHHLSVTPPAGSTHAVLQLLLTPQGGPTQAVEQWALDMPGIDKAGRFSDAYGNTAHLLNQSRPEGALLATVEGVVSTTDRHGVLGRPAGEPVPALFKRVTPLTKGSAAIHGKFARSKEKRLDVLHGLMARVGEVLDLPELDASQSQSQSQMMADGKMSQSQGTPARTVASATDYAHVFIGAARALDIPARFVTGYLIDAGEDQSAFHAWAEAYDEALGWIGFDPLLQLCPTDRHVRLATGLDAMGTLPIRAVPAGPGIETLELSVTRLD